MIPARHSHKAGNKLRQERQVESDEDHECTESSPAFRIHSTANLRPPVVKSSKISHQRAAHHDVVEVSNYEIGITQVNVDRERSQKQSSHAADGKQSNEP